MGIDLMDRVNSIFPVLDKFYRDLAQKEIKNVYVEFGQYQAKEFMNAYRTKVNEWYSSYTPKYYKRNWSLRNIASPAFKSKGTLLYDETIGDYDDLYDEYEMTTGRAKSGNVSLFEKVFKDGWHGGAYGCDWDPDTPHYRTGRNFCEWGDTAERGETADGYDSVYESMDAWFKEMSDGVFNERLQEMVSDRITNKVFPQVQKKAAELLANI